MANAVPHIVVFPDSRRDAQWVLRGAFATLAIGAWLVVLVHLALLVRAEVRLHRIVHQANAFASLPRVNAAELQAFVARRTTAMGLETPQIVIRPEPGGRVRLHRVKANTAEALPRMLQFKKLGERETIVGSGGGSWLAAAGAQK